MSQKFFTLLRVHSHLLHSISKALQLPHNHELMLHYVHFYALLPVHSCLPHFLSKALQFAHDNEMMLPEFPHFAACGFTSAPFSIKSFAIAS